jgi:DNA-binding NarL/FixJ family response regulator
MIKILIADDHAIVREGLKQILSQTPDMVVVAEASNGQEALDKLARNNIDLIVLDISMPGKDGLDVLSEIMSKRPQLPVLILSMYPAEQYAVRVLKAGASGYLTKESAPDELVKAIRQISEGKKYISPSLAEKLALV